MRKYQKLEIAGIYTLHAAKENHIYETKNFAKDIVAQIWDLAKNNFRQTLPYKMKLHEAFFSFKFLESTKTKGQAELYKKTLTTPLFCVESETAFSEKLAVVYEWFFIDNAGNEVNYIGQSLDFRNRILEHYLGFRSYNKTKTTSKPFVQQLQKNGKAYTDVLLKIHFAERLNIESAFKLDYLESELILAAKKNKDVINCNIQRGVLGKFL